MFFPRPEPVSAVRKQTSNRYHVTTHLCVSTYIINNGSYKVMLSAQNVYGQFLSSDQELLGFQHVALHGEHCRLSQQTFC